MQDWVVVTAEALAHDLQPVKSLPVKISEKSFSSAEKTVVTMAARVRTSLRNMVGE